MTENDRGKNVERYVGEIKGGLRPAMKITIIGVICSNPKSFAVTLLCDPLDASKDIGLLLAVNFSEKSITRNALIAGKWGREEKTIPYFPFTAGDTFKTLRSCNERLVQAHEAPCKAILLGLLDCKACESDIGLPGVRYCAGQSGICALCPVKKIRKYWTCAMSSIF
ncbi:galectin-related protein A-like isoform X1 [Pelodiscus sinensis]|uniref:galectin-related protein A-like isoform X1 n=1 Tax=Pelodiscus sinensis TaxID=13735 RepID=UPI000D723B43|nr:galectin-related protein A-like isoform X1 [Pelodiscus sinensis]|eukprot:XP_025035686.1 galectin-related protein A-like isoform X1 [Pelodiscus sinensis]